MNEISNLIKIFFKDKTLNNETYICYFADVFTLNLDKNKMFMYKMNTSSLGFLMNCIYCLLKLFYEINDRSIFETIFDIDMSFACSTRLINYAKIDKVDPDASKLILETDLIENNNKNYNITTKLFYIIHGLLSVTVKNFQSEYQQVVEQFRPLYDAKMFTNPKL